MYVFPVEEAIRVTLLMCVQLFTSVTRCGIWSIYTDLQSFLGTFPIQKVSILAVEDYSFEDRDEFRTLAR